MDSFVGLASTFMDMDMDEAQFVAHGTQYFANLAEAWRGAGPHLYRANQIRRAPKKCLQADHAILSKHLQKANIPTQPSPLNHHADVAPQNAPDTPARSVSAAKVAPPAPTVAKVSSTDASSTTAHATTNKVLKNKPDSMESAPKPTETIHSKPTPVVHETVQKKLNKEEAVVTPAPKKAPAVASLPASVDVESIATKKVATFVAAPPSTDQMDLDGESGEKSGGAKRSPNDHTASAEKVRNFLQLIESGAHLVYASSIQPWQDIFAEAKDDLATYDGAPNDHKRLIRKTGGIVKAWLKHYDAQVAKANKQTRRPASGGNASTTSLSRMDVDHAHTTVASAAPATKPAPLIPSASSLSSNASTSSIPDDAAAPIVSNFVNKMQLQKQQQSSSTPASTSPAAAVANTISNVSAQSSAPRMAPKLAEANEKKRTHDKLLPAPPSSKSSTVAGASKKSVMNPPSAKRRSKYLLDMADEEDDDGSEGGVDDLDDSQDDDLDGFIVNSDDESFVEEDHYDDDDDDDDMDEVGGNDYGDDDAQSGRGDMSGSSDSASQ